MISSSIFSQPPALGVFILELRIHPGTDVRANLTFKLFLLFSNLRNCLRVEILVNGTQEREQKICEKEARSAKA